MLVLGISASPRSAPARESPVEHLRRPDPRRRSRRRGEWHPLLLPLATFALISISTRPRPCSPPPRSPSTTRPSRTTRRASSLVTMCITLDLSLCCSIDLHLHIDDDDDHPPHLIYPSMDQQRCLRHSVHRSVVDAHHQGIRSGPRSAAQSHQLHHPRWIAQLVTDHPPAHGPTGAAPSSGDTLSLSMARCCCHSRHKRRFFSRCSSTTITPILSSSCARSDQPRRSRSTTTITTSSCSSSFFFCCRSSS